MNQKLFATIRLTHVAALSILFAPIAFGQTQNAPNSKASSALDMKVPERLNFNLDPNVYGIRGVSSGREKVQKKAFLIVNIQKKSEPYNNPRELITVTTAEAPDKFTVQQILQNQLGTLSQNCKEKTFQYQVYAIAEKPLPVVMASTSCQREKPQFTIFKTVINEGVAHVFEHSWFYVPPANEFNHAVKAIAGYKLCQIGKTCDKVDLPIIKNPNKVDGKKTDGNKADSKK